MTTPRLKAKKQLCHGFRGDPEWANPIIVTRCDTEARPGYNSCKAHEYREEPEVLTQKIKMLADLIRKAKRCTAYTGAGISTSSGINDYASKAKDSKALQRPVLKTPLAAKPTLAHRVLAGLHKAGHLHHWVQQNHDGLPQKAGYPQYALNEIHGAWFDPSNPVVKMSGSLRDDLFAWMLKEEKQTDLCLAMGTSLCGMNADRVATTPAKKALKGKALGTVIVSLQQTKLDHLASLRIFATIDEVMEKLAAEMELDYDKQGVPYCYPRPTDKVFWGKRCYVSKAMPIVGRCYRSKNSKPQLYLCGSSYDALPPLEKENYVELEKPNKKENAEMVDVFDVPYDKNGKLLPEGKRDSMLRLDLREGAKIIMKYGSFEGDKGMVLGLNSQGHFQIALKHDVEKEYHHGQKHRPRSRRTMGRFMVEAAVNGQLDHLPFVNRTNDK